MKKCEKCGKEKQTTRELILGPRGFRLHDVCHECYTAYINNTQTVKKPVAQPATQATVTPRDGI